MEGDDGPRPKGGGKGKDVRVNAQFSDMPATECIGAGRLDGWFSTPAYIAENRGWGYIGSFCFEGDLFFHLQRSPWLRGINFQKKDEVTFEVIEVNGKCEAVKLLLPKQVQELEDKASGAPSDDKAAVDLVGTRIRGIMKSHHMLVEKQHWGFVGSDLFPGQIFWHTSESPEMIGVPFDRDDVVEYEVAYDDSRGGQVRAKSMTFISKPDRPLIYAPELSDNKRRKKEQWLKNWSTTPPPDWVCKHCGWQNFGRNKTCTFNNKNNQNCPGTRPPREEWPDTVHIKASEVDDQDAPALKALHARWQAHLQYGKVDEVPAGWHASAPKSIEGWEVVAAPVKSAPIPVPVLGKEEGQLLLEAGLPGAIAAKQLQDRLAAEQAWQTPPPPPRPASSSSQGGWSAGYGGYGAPPAYGGGGYDASGYGYGGYGKASGKDWGKDGKGGGKGGKGCKGKDDAAATASIPTDDGQATMATCLQSFNELSNLPPSSQDAQVAVLVSEVNEILGADRSAKHAFAMQLARHPFFDQQKFEVRYQPGKNQIIVARPGAQHVPQVVQPPDAYQQRLLRQS